MERGKREGGKRGGEERGGEERGGERERGEKRERRGGKKEWEEGWRRVRLGRYFVSFLFRHQNSNPQAVNSIDSYIILNYYDSYIYISTLI